MEDKSEKELQYLLKNSLGFHFSLINIIPMIALAVKTGRKKKEKQDDLYILVQQSVVSH